ncbi:MAG: hypothetical protein ACPGO5_00470 [Patescibacteria group bacterium]
MHSVFIIPGYGIPKNILKDEHYNFYLKIVFNTIYRFVTEKQYTKPLIIPAGGRTDMYKPYRRTEAGEMMKVLRKLKSRRFVSQVTSDWEFAPERKSISTLENLLFSKDILKKHNIKSADLYIFCEYTRGSRLKVIAKEIFGKQYKITVLPIDFDVSKLRYADPGFLKKKERVEINHTKWALQSPENLKEHHKLFKKKITYLRTIEPRMHQRAIKEWWESMMELQ